jgi:hypothetical protein
MTMAGERIMETHRLENRRFKRARMVVAVKISHPESDGNSGQLVHTLDLGTSGAKLGGLREEIIVGKIVVLHRKHKKATCKIVWTRDEERELHVGIQLLKADPDFWGLDLAEENLSPRGKLDAKLQMLLTKS